jgi:hypothetical protein
VHFADAVRTHGFRKWYERELLRGHAHLLLTLLCTIGLLAGFEALSATRRPLDWMVDIVAVVLCGGAGAWSLRRYLYLLMHAEAVANQASCPGCGVYARLRPLPGPRADALPVACRGCGREWTIEG